MCSYVVGDGWNHLPGGSPGSNIYIYIYIYYDDDDDDDDEFGWKSRVEPKISRNPMVESIMCFFPINTCPCRFFGAFGGQSPN